MAVPGQNFHPVSGFNPKAFKSACQPLHALMGFSIGVSKNASVQPFADNFLGPKLRAACFMIVVTFSG
jgi:hypothetical protein